MPVTPAAVVVAIAVISGTAVLASGEPAHASFDRNGIGCQASGFVSSGDTTTRMDGRDSVIRVPRSGRIAWRGSTDEPTHQQRGRLAIEIGPLEVSLVDWGPSANEGELRTQNDIRSLPWVFDLLPPGQYRLVGSHRAVEGECSGSLILVVGGSVVGLSGSLVLGFTLLWAILIYVSARARRHRRGHPIVGAMAGGMLGLCLAAELVVLRVVASDSALFVALPAILVLAGLAGGFFAPFGRRRVGPAG